MRSIAALHHDRRHRSRSRLGTRLLVTVLVPTIALTAFGAVGLFEREQRTVAASNIEAQVGRVNSALDQYVTLVAEKSASQLVVMASDFGLSPAEASDLLDIDMAAKLRAARTSLDTSAAPDPTSALGRRMPAIAVLRAAIDEGTADPAHVQTTYGETIDLAQQAWIQEAQQLEEMTSDAQGSAPVRRAGSALLLTTKAFAFGSNETSGAAQLAVPGLASTDAPRQDLALARGLYLQTVDDLERLQAPLAAAVWRDRIVNDPDVQAFEAFVDVLLAETSPAVPTIDIIGLATVFRSGLIRQDRLQEAVEAAATDTVNAAQQLRSAARDDLVNQLGMLAALIVVSIGFTTVTAHSIVRPLHRLARRAAEVSAGDIDGPALAISGPAEVAVVTEAFNESVANLRAVATEAMALAAADFDHPALRNPVPGPLGRALQGSVDRLAESMRDNELLRQDLAKKATHDALTGLPNRVLLLDRLEQAVVRTDRSPVGSLAVVFIDLDNFKLVNDAIGHSTGDALLVDVARRIRASVRPADTVARFSGDEFVVVLEGIDGALEAEVICERIRDRLDPPFRIGSSELVVTASQGIAVAAHGESAEDLLRIADAAMYAAKERGPARTEVADAAIRGRATRRLQFEVDMRRGLQNGEFVVYFQPVVSLADGSVIGAEALARWHDPTRGLIAPDEFIPVAEETGLIMSLGEQILTQALEEAVRWPTPRPGAAPLTVAINVSARQFVDPNLAEVVARAIAVAGIDAGRVHLEVTETALMRDIDRSALVLENIAVQGVRISIDDFGTGYSSLRYIQQLPISVLKIDRCFIAPLTGSNRDASIVSTVIELARTLGATVVAEGVETAAQRQELLRLGCRQAQGYYFDRPMPAADFAAQLQAATLADGPLPLPA